MVLQTNNVFSLFYSGVQRGRNNSDFKSGYEHKQRSDCSGRSSQSRKRPKEQATS